MILILFCPNCVQLVYHIYIYIYKILFFFIFYFLCIEVALRVNGIQATAIASQGLPSLKFYGKAWNCLLQAVVGAE